MAREPDYQRFVETVQSGAPFSIHDLIHLALECGTPIPKDIRRIYIHDKEKGRE